MNKSLYRRMHVNTIAFVLALHAFVVWAGVTMQSPERPLVDPKSVQAIQIELIQSTITEASMPSITDEPVVTKEILPSKTKKIIVEPVEVEPIEKVVIATESPSVEKVAAKESLEATQVVIDKTFTNNSKNESNDKASKNENEQSKNDKAVEDTETDLSAIIRAIRAQYKRDQARQRRNLSNQNNRELVEKAKLKMQTDADDLDKLLTQVADQTKLQDEQINKSETAQEENNSLDQSLNEDESFIRLSEDNAIWRTEHQPITDIPLVVWRNAKARSGDLFIVLLELHVDKEGYITEVQLLESSGNPIIDAVATTQVRTGQLEPLLVNNVAVEAIVPKSLVYIMP